MNPLNELLAAVAANPSDNTLRAIAADAMEETHGHRCIEPWLPAPLSLMWDGFGVGPLNRFLEEVGVPPVDQEHWAFRFTLNLIAAPAMALGSILAGRMAQKEP